MLIKKFWNNLGITRKFSLIFSIMSGIIVLLCAISYLLLSTTHRQTVSEIGRSYHIQNIVLDMDRDIEKARRLKHELYLTLLTTTKNPSRDDFVKQVNIQLGRASKNSQLLRELVLNSNVNSELKKSHININLYYSIANRCQILFRNLLQHINEMISDKTGLQELLEEKRGELEEELKTWSNIRINNMFTQMQLHIKEYLITRQRPSMQSAINSAVYLERELHELPFIQKDALEPILDALQGYMDIAKKIPELDARIRTISNDFDLNTETLEPVSMNLVELARKDVELSQQKNKDMERLTGMIILMAALFGFLLVGFLAALIHMSITINIIRLTRIASELKEGNFDLHINCFQEMKSEHSGEKNNKGITSFNSSSSDSRPYHHTENNQLTENKIYTRNDELGLLWEAFSAMTHRLVELIDGLEQQVDERTKELVHSNISLKKEMKERQAAEKATRKLETQLRQSHKMEAIGTLAGGIAHDFNNILGIILGHCELAMDDIEEFNPVRLNLKEIKTATIRARDIVRQLLSFSRKNEHKKEQIKLHSIVMESIQLLRATIPSTIEIKLDLADEEGLIKADPSQIHQVIINLCTNAAHAMEMNGGALEINVKKVIFDSSIDIQFKKLKPGRYVQLTIKDTGSGIAPELIDKIFDPYFTTKEVGKGTGMGLSIVHGIITSHDGAISVYSEPGKGSRFTVLLPLIENIDMPLQEETEIIPTGDETILFIDDEPSMVFMAKKALEKLGYSVDTETDPTEALKRIYENPDRYQLVITDMTMPKMTGANLAKRIIKFCPKMPILLCTGFSINMNPQTAAETGIRRYIEKPLNRSELAMAVRSVLDESLPQKAKNM
ncbi:putative Histidine kinase [Desulfamplus magnetovallimortis]|uniref:histidine kinase n=1 Tax=Desulfamplus magnetovallimortis TaxID=1246637 RepID=A0A1W1H6W3_9BACT|nr:ATP-binding protein [Desulfamplus magnetovallimortis]SLM28221.1 putative Histidine kinase [Desulfamplus magnetovallimortis]